ncbi:hypothetical protein CsSME_00051760 [Camellia sinensis var. sinensis]
MKDMGEASYVLGVKILRDRSRRLLGLSQETYIKTILERFQMQSCKPIDTPVAKGESLSLDMGPKTQEENEKMARVPYANAVGSLIGYYDILEELQITHFATRSSKKQSCIALSTMEAEFVACSSAVQEAVWLRRFLQHLDVVTHTSDPVTIHCDSMAALAYAKDPKYHGRTKHIDVRFNFIRDILAQKEVILEHIPTSRMVADPLTKPIARDARLAHSHEQSPLALGSE